MSHKQYVNLASMESSSDYMAYETIICIRFSVNSMTTT